MERYQGRPSSAVEGAALGTTSVYHCRPCISGPDFLHLSYYSIAGLLAAAVCADHFESVLVIEPEEWANEHGMDLPQHQSYRTLSDGHKEPVVARTRIMQYMALHCEYRS